MSKQTEIKIFNDKQVRTHWDSEQEKWFIVIVDVIAVLTESIDPNAYWRKLKQRLKIEGNETVTNCHGLKMLAADGKMRMTDVADTEQLFRLIQSIPSPKAEPFKLWLAKVATERYNHLKNRGWQHQNTGANQRKYRYQGILLQMNTYELNSISLFINKTKRSLANTCQNEWLDER